MVPRRSRFARRRGQPSYLRARFAKDLRRDLWTGDLQPRSRALATANFKTDAFGDRLNSSASADLCARRRLPRSCGRRGGCMRRMLLVAVVGTLAACGGTVLTDTKKEAVSGGCSLQTPNSCGPGFVCCPPGNPPDGWDGTGFCVQGTDPRICRQIQ